jgi:hypothetical protein
MARYEPYISLLTTIQFLNTSHCHLPPRPCTRSNWNPVLTLTRPLQAFLWSIPLLDEPASVHEYYARETVRARAVASLA